MRTVAFGFVVGLACVTVWPATAAAQSAITGVVKDAIGRGTARRDRRSGKRRLIEKSAASSPTARASTASSTCGPASTVVTFTLDGLQHRSSATASICRPNSRHDQRRAAARRARRNHHGHRRIAGRRRHDRRATPRCSTAKRSTRSRPAAASRAWRSSSSASA